VRALVLPLTLAALASPAAAAPYCWKELPLPPGLGPLSGAATDGARRWLLGCERGAVRFLEWDGAISREVPLPEEIARGDPAIAAGPLLSFAGHLARWSGAAWQPLGTPTSAFPEMAPDVWLDAVGLRRDGRPVAAWRPWNLRTPTSQPLLVAAWEGGRWVPLGGPLDPGSDLRRAGVALAVDERDRPWIAWAAGSRNAAVLRVMRWSGAGWEDVGDTARGALGGPEVADDWAVSLLVLPGGRAVVAWIAAGQPAIGAAEWDGERWSGMGPPLAVEDATGAPARPILAAGRDGAVFLAEQVADEIGFDALYVQQWAGGGWQWVVEGAHLEQTGDARLVAFEGGPSRLRLTWNEASPHALEAGPCRWAESPEPFPRKHWRRTGWPSTIEDAAEETLSLLKPEELAFLQGLTREELVDPGWTAAVRRACGPWEGNAALLNDCGTPSADDCTMIILRRVWERVNVVQPPP